MELPACNTYHSVYPKCQEGAYAQFFQIPVNPQNQYFVQNQWDQSKCLGTSVICFDTKYGALPPNSTVPKNMDCVQCSSSLREQALCNRQLKTIIAQRPETQAWAIQS